MRRFRSLVPSYVWSSITPSGGSEPTTGGVCSLIGVGEDLVYFTWGGGATFEFWYFDWGTQQWTDKGDITVNVNTPVTAFSDDSAYIWICSNQYWTSSTDTRPPDRLTISDNTYAEITTSGTGGAVDSTICGDKANQTVYQTYLNPTTFVLNDIVGKGVITGTSMVRSGINNGSAASSFAKSSLGFCPDDGMIYVMANTAAAWDSAWTLSANDIFYMDPTVADWTQVSGVTNSAGSIVMSNANPLGRHMVWVPSESAFFIVEPSQVLKFDPATKILSSLFVDRSFSANCLNDSIAGRASIGEMGRVVVTSNGLFAVNYLDSSATARIEWLKPS